MLHPQLDLGHPSRRSRPSFTHARINCLSKRRSPFVIKRAQQQRIRNVSEAQFGLGVSKALRATGPGGPVRASAVAERKERKRLAEAMRIGHLDSENGIGGTESWEECGPFQAFESLTVKTQVPSAGCEDPVDVRN